MKFPHCAATVIAGKLAILSVVPSRKMSHAENIQTITNYHSWKVAPPAVIEAGAKSVYKESNRLCDNWGYEIREAGLYDTRWEMYVHDAPKLFPHPNRYLGNVEDEIISAMDNWAIYGSEKFFIWISPIFYGEYPCHKAEFIMRSDDGCSTVNFSINFDGVKEVALEVAKKIFPELESLKDTEQLRKSVIIKNDFDITKALEIISPYIDKPKEIKTVAEESFKYIAQLVTNGTNQLRVVQEMDRLGMIGEKSFSCPGGRQGLAGSLESSSINLNETVRYIECHCPICDKDVTAMICGQTITCLSCGASATAVCV